MRIIQSLQNRASCAVPLQRRGKDQFRYDEHAQDFEPEDQARVHDHTAISAVVTIRRDFLDTQGPRRWVVVRGDERVQAVWPIRSIFALTRSEQSTWSLLQTTSTLEIVSSQPAVGGTVLPRAQARDRRDGSPHRPDCDRQGPVDHGRRDGDRGRRGVDRARCVPVAAALKIEGPRYAGLVQSAIAFLCLSGRAEPVPRSALRRNNHRWARHVCDAPAERADHARRCKQCDNPFLHFVLPFIEERAVRPFR